MKFAFFSMLGIACAQCGLDRPQMGTMVDHSGAARPVFGVAASVTLGDPALTGVISSACSDSWCIFKTANSIVVAGQTLPAPAGAALFAIDGMTAAIYFPASGQIARYQNGQLAPAAVQIEGEVMGLLSTSGTMQFAVRRNESIWIVDQQDNAIDSIPAFKGPVMLLPAGVLYTSGDQVILRRADASQVSFSAPGAKSFSALATNYVQIHAAGMSYALRIDAGRERIFELPEPAQ